MRIKGKFGLNELKDCLCAFGTSIVAALLVWCVFALANLISWFLCVVLIAIILTPISFWGIRWLRGAIVITDDSEEEVESFIRFEED